MGITLKESLLTVNTDPNEYSNYIVAWDNYKLIKAIHIHCRRRILTIIFQDLKIKNAAIGVRLVSGDYDLLWIMQDWYLQGSYTTDWENMYNITCVAFKTVEDAVQFKETVDRMATEYLLSAVNEL